jgi:hypothetical protein
MSLLPFSDSGEEHSPLGATLTSHQWKKTHLDERNISNLASILPVKLLRAALSSPYYSAFQAQGNQQPVPDDQRPRTLPSRLLRLLL